MYFFKKMISSGFDPRSKKFGGISLSYGTSIHWVFLLSIGLKEKEKEKKYSYEL